MFSSDREHRTISVRIVVDVLLPGACHDQTVTVCHTHALMRQFQIVSIQ
jgi:hypothetical protein